MSDLFLKKPLAPLPERMRPKSLQHVVGQDHLLGEGGPLTLLLEKKFLPSLILWGPPGSGKTTLAALLADAVGMELIQVSAIFTGVQDLKKVFERAAYLSQSGQRVLLFVDEIHRFNRAQQDAFLPHMESGLITLVGATTENPSFELNGALLSRAQVLTLKSLGFEALDVLLQRAEAILGHIFNLSVEAKEALFEMAQGDGRYFLSLLESLSLKEGHIKVEDLSTLLQRKGPNHDKKGEQHYNLISVLHKAIRGSHVDAALYWFSRMMHGGEDPLYVGRRMIRMASEDIGMADPQALPFVVAAVSSFERLGSPEGELALAQAVVYLATAPKSNGVYKAFNKAWERAGHTSDLMPPMHSLNAPTELMKKQGYGKGYRYDHDTPEGFSGQNYFPEDLREESFYSPVKRGFEREIKKRLEYWAKRRS